MNHADAFLAEILVAPADDGPRLRYSDWLEERGEFARAEFIRVQCELARHPREVEWLRQMPVEQWSGSPEEGVLLRRLDPLIRRKRELLGAHALAWSDPVMETGLVPACTKQADGRYGYGDASWAFRRGFVAEISLSAAAWLTHADALLAAAPIEAVALTTWVDWHDDGGVPVLHDAIHPNVGPTRRPCRLATRPEGFGGYFDPLVIGALLAAEWPRIKFTLPPAFQWDRRGASPLSDFRAATDALRAAEGRP